MGWRAQLQIDYTLEAGRCVARHQHQGPLRILQPLYPEGDSICHHVLVHPPGGLVGGDRLELQVQVGPGAHALITTPGASRFYRSDGPTAVQHTRLTLHDGARLEWLPQETLCYDQCQAENHLHLNLQGCSEMMGWDVLAFGLPLASRPMLSGRVLQHLSLQDVWLERGLIDATDSRLMDGPLGLDGQRCMGTLWLAGGQPLDRERADRALDLARHCGLDQPDVRSGATWVQPRVIVVRALGPLVEPVMKLLRSIRCAWRQQLWKLEPHQPRIWSM